jgi:hypothetical protein
MRHDWRDRERGRERERESYSMKKKIDGGKERGVQEREYV